MLSSSVPASPRGEEQDHNTIIVGNVRYLPEYFEEIIRNEIKIVSSVAVFGKQCGLICLVTLQVNPELGGRELASHVLAAAKDCGSRATTVVTARQCPRFKTLLQDIFQKLNQSLCLQIQRVSVLLQDFSTESGLLRSDGNLNRTMIAYRHHNLIEPALGSSMNPSGCTVDIPSSVPTPESEQSTIRQYQKWFDEKNQNEQAERIKISTKRKINQESLQEISHEENRVPSRRSSISTVRDSPRKQEISESAKPDIASKKPHHLHPYDYKEWCPENEASCPADDSKGQMGIKDAPFENSVVADSGHCDFEANSTVAEDYGFSEEGCNGVLSPHTAAFCQFARCSTDQDAALSMTEVSSRIVVCSPHSTDFVNQSSRSLSRVVAPFDQHLEGPTQTSPATAISLFNENPEPREPEGGSGQTAPAGAKPRKAQTPRASQSPNLNRLSDTRDLEQASTAPDRGERARPRARRRQGLQVADRPGAEVRFVQMCYASPRESDTESLGSSGGSDWSIVFDPEGAGDGNGSVRQARSRRSSVASCGSSSSLENHSPTSSPFQNYLRPPFRSSSNGSEQAVGGGPSRAMTAKSRSCVSWGGERSLGPRREGRKASTATLAGHGDHSPLWAKLMAPTDSPQRTVPRPTPPPQPQCGIDSFHGCQAAANSAFGDSESASDKNRKGSLPASESSIERDPSPAARMDIGLAAACRRIQQSLHFVRGAQAVVLNTSNVDSLQSSQCGTDPNVPLRPLSTNTGVSGVLGSAGACFGYRDRPATSAVLKQGEQGPPHQDQRRRQSAPRVLAVRPAVVPTNVPRSPSKVRLDEAGSPGNDGRPARRRSLLECVFPGLGSACKRMRGSGGGSGGNVAEGEDR